jgi:hypothetical protein
VLLEDLALGVVANVHDVDEATQIELLGSELGHGCGVLGILVLATRTCGSKLPESIVRQDMELVWRQTGFMRRAAKRRRIRWPDKYSTARKNYQTKSQHCSANT